MAPTPPSISSVACVFCLETSSCCPQKESREPEGFVKTVLCLIGITSSESNTRSSSTMDKRSRPPTCSFDLDLDLNFPHSPFCGKCLDKGRELLALQKRLEDIQVEMQVVREELKLSVKNSRKNEDTKGLPTSYFHIRRQLLESGRRICSKRLANISGIPLDQQSNLSSDDLSQCGDSQAGNEAQTLSVKAEAPETKVFKEEVKVKKQEPKDEAESDQDQDDDSDKETGYGLDIAKLKFGRSLRSNSLPPPPEDDDDASSDAETERLPTRPRKRQKFELPDKFESEDPEEFEDVELEMAFAVPSQPLAGRVLRNLKWKEYDYDDNGQASYGGVPVAWAESGLRCGATECTYEVKRNEKKRPENVMKYHIRTKHYLVKKCRCVPIKRTPHICPSRPRKSEKTCKSCGSVFPNQSLLTTHDCPEKKEKDRGRSSTNANVSKFACSLCSKILSSKRTLQNHLLTHEKSVEERRTAQCHVCGKNFTPTELTSHLRKHRIGTEFQEWKCDRPGCSKKFPHPSKLKRHQKTHNNAQHVS